MHKLPYNDKIEQYYIRSFVTRTRKITYSQLQVINKLGKQFLLPYRQQILNIYETFHRKAQTILEIGFGMGEASAQIAVAMPEKNFIGVDVYTPGVSNLLKLIHKNNLNNLRICQFNAIDVLTYMIEPESLIGIHVFFPDPWYKTRHKKRRLIQKKIVNLLASRLILNGYLHCATDWEDYAKQMLEVMHAEHTLKNSTNNYAQRPDYRPISKFESRGLRLSHNIWDLIFIKC